METTGVVKFFNHKKGFGFIVNDENGEEIFVHANNLLDKIKDGDPVIFSVEQTPKGPAAVNVEKYEEDEEE